MALPQHVTGALLAGDEHPLRPDQSGTLRAEVEVALVVRAPRRRRERVDEPSVDAELQHRVAVVVRVAATVLTVADGDEQAAAGVDGHAGRRPDAALTRRRHGVGDR